MADRLQAQLTGERRPGREALRFGFQHQIGRVFQAAGLVARLCDLDTGQARLRRVVDVASRNIQAFRDPVVVDFGLDTVGVTGPVEVKVMGDKLVRAGVFPDDGSLPGRGNR